MFLHVVIGAVGHAAQQLPRIFVADAPSLDDVEECLQRRRAESFTGLARFEIDQRRRRMPRRGISQRTQKQTLLIRSDFDSWMKCTPSWPARQPPAPRFERRDWQWLHKGKPLHGLVHCFHKRGHLSHPKATITSRDARWLV